MCLMVYANNKGADHPANPHSLISTFVVRYLDSVKCMLALSKVSRFWLVPVAEQAGLNLTWSKIPEDTFLRDVAHIREFPSSADFSNIRIFRHTFLGNYEA